MFDLSDPVVAVAAALEAAPGPGVITVLASVDASRLDPRTAVDLLVAWERQSAWLSAQTVAATAAVASASRELELTEPSGDGAFGELALRAEVAAAIGLSDLTAGSRVAVADELMGRLGMVQAALASGAISYWKASAICEATEGLSDAQACWVAERILGRASTQTLSQLRRSLGRAVERVAPGRSRKRAAQARAEQDVILYPQRDGQAVLRMTGDAADVQAVYNAVQEAARKLLAMHPDGGLPRSAGQLRVDALLRLATGAPFTSDLAGPDGGVVERTRPYKVSLSLVMDLPTLLGLRDNPAELEGYGALPASLARELAADASWRRLLCDPQTGTLLDLGRLQYRPSAPLARWIRTRDRVCVFPTCSRRAVTCELDHAVPHRTDGSGGATDRHNLHPLCKKHHRLKHESGWTLRTSEFDPPVWLSPLGQTYPVEHHDYRPPDDLDFAPIPEEPDDFMSDEDECDEGEPHAVPVSSRDPAGWPQTVPWAPVDSGACAVDAPF